MNTPELRTERLILCKFEEEDLKAIYEIYSDIEVNRFLPWFPVRTMAEAKKFYEERFQCRYHQQRAYNYAICLKEDNYPIGYLNIEMSGSYDLGYGLRKEFWNKGIVTEAGRAVIEQVRKDGIPYLTATHDVNNPASGRVMEKMGMKYQYSYEEQWQPKDMPVIFRMYQRNLDGQNDRVYQRYWDESRVHFIENIEGQQKESL